MLVKDVFMELRSRLRSCNVFITTGVDFSKNCNLKISIQSNCIVINYYGNDDYCFKNRRDSLSSIESLSDCYSDEEPESVTISIENFCYLIPNSMSCLKIDRNNISFRILTESRNGGNFYKELLSTNTVESGHKYNELKVNVKANDNLKILCSNCLNTVSDNEIKFDRILELPTENLDMSEWFCHGHGHAHGQSHGHTESIGLKPNKNDFLYRLTFFVVSNVALSEKTNKFNIKREIYHCNRCLAWLGIKEKEMVKLFNSNVKLSQNGFDTHIFSHKKEEEDTPIGDFIYTIEIMIKEFNLGFQYTVMCKIVLECIISSMNKQYILIWVMDKELQVLQNMDQILNDRVELQSCFLTKILYKVEMSLNEEVETWLTDPGVVSTPISKIMFSKGIEHLQKMSLKIPEPFRNSNGYFVSYLKV